MSTKRVEIIKEQFVQLTEPERVELFQYLVDEMKAKLQNLRPKAEKESELFQRLATQIRTNLQNAQPKSKKDVAKAEIRRQQNMEWMKANDGEFGGQYVALDGGKLVAVGKSFPETMKAARASGVENPFVTYLPKPDEVGYMGGWL